MAGGKGKIKPEDGKQFSSDYQPKEKWSEKRATDLGSELIDWLNAEDENVFFQEFLIINKKLYPDITRYLCNKYSSFYELIETAKKIQEIKLVKFGVFDKLNSTMTKFVLINHHEYTDKNTTVLEGGEKPIEISFED